MIEIDASFGEGGGQILRSALALSVITGAAMRLTKVRAHRPQPGLKPQHLQAVKAAAAISAAKVEGAALGSQTLCFEPAGLQAGKYAFDIGTAGSVSLLLQTLALPLSFADGPSRLTLVGAIDAWLADQLLLPLAFVPDRRFPCAASARTCAPTPSCCATSCPLRSRSKAKPASPVGCNCRGSACPDPCRALSGEVSVAGHEWRGGTNILQTPCKSWKHS
jgi:RNA 3'-terminal phosphate cyclase